VTDTIDSTSTDTANTASSETPKKRSGGLNSMLLADLKSMAGGLGISGTGSMKKAQLVDAIKAAQSGGRSSRAGGSDNGRNDQRERTDSIDSEQQGEGHEAKASTLEPRDDQDPSDQARNDGRQGNQGRRNNDGRQNDGRQGNQRQEQNKQEQGQKQDQSQSKQDQNNQGAYDEGGSRRSRRRRGRDRDRTTATGGRPTGGSGNAGSQRNEPDTTILEDDVLTPAAGILDVLDNYAFVRTSGYLPGADDVYVSLSMVRKYGLRRGDAIVGQVRQPREGERKEKFNPMVRIDSVNGADPEAAKHRVDFAKLTPLYPSERLRLETEPTNLIGRVIDIAAPIGKGQRGLIVSPSKAGKTMIMQSIASSIMTNNPECHLMVVLVDERPEEVTDFERSTKGEVISSTFDRPASDHTIVAELAIERAKRLVELGHDVVVLLDGITRLGRAYNLAAPASGRILSGGVDSAALYPPKRFFGAARNIENGGSLTILATALIESGSKMDEVIFEEFKGTGNMEIRLRRDFADKRLFPAIDAVQSGTRREELLMSKEELAIVWKLRRVLSALDGQQALELLLGRLKKSQSNIEFLMQVQKTTPGAMGDTD
jgi:transcription termination factor Rho